MKYLKTMGLFLIAASAMSAVTATTATATVRPLPALAQCVQVTEEKTGLWNEAGCKKLGGTKAWTRTWNNSGIEIEAGVWCQKVWVKKKGRYNNVLCTELGGSKEWILTKHIRKFTGKSAKEVKPVLETVGAKTVTCTEDKSEGEFTGDKTAGNIKVTFKGCKSSGVNCNTPKAAVGEIITKALEGEIGDVHSEAEAKAGKNEVGLALWPSGRTKEEKEKHKFEALFVEFECTGLAVSKVRGSVIGEIKPVSKITNEGTEETEGEGEETFTTAPELVFKQTAGKQAITKLEGVEGGVKEVLESSLNKGAFEESAEATTENNTTEDAMAVVTP